MSEARRNLDWEKQFELAMDGEKSKKILCGIHLEREDGLCTMCEKSAVSVLSIKSSYSYDRHHGLINIQKKQPASFQ